MLLILFNALKTYMKSDYKTVPEKGFDTDLPV